jgi:hypothetical protein
MRYLIALLILPTSLWAENFDVLEGDTKLSRIEVVQLTSKPVVEFYEGGQSRYAVGGAYNYTYKEGAAAFGRFEITEDGTVCITYRNGRTRCDRFVHSHGRLVMLTQDGQRFAIRP